MAMVLAIRGGWLPPNEVREQEGLPPDPHGGELMSSRDLIPLRISVDTPELLLGGTAPAPEKKEETTSSGPSDHLPQRGRLLGDQPGGGVNLGKENDEK